MRTWITSRMQVLAGFGAIVLVPAYLGLGQTTGWRMLLYSVVASVLLSVGERLEGTQRAGEDFKVFLQQVILWWLVIVALGGFAYAIGFEIAAYTKGPSN